MTMPDPRIHETLRLLAAYRPAPIEAETYQDMVDMLGGTSAPLDRDQFEPGHFTAGGFVVNSERSDVLMIEHRKLGRWLQPGGHIDIDDSGPEGAARREIEEETGVGELIPLDEGIFAVDIHAIPAHGDEPAHHHYDVLFAFTTADVTLRPSAEVAAARWVPLAEAGSLDIDEATLRALIRLRALLARD